MTTPVSRRPPPHARASALALFASVAACATTVAGGGSSRDDATTSGRSDREADASLTDVASDLARDAATRDAAVLDGADASSTFDAVTVDGRVMDALHDNDTDAWSELSDVPMLERTFRSCPRGVLALDCRTAVVSGGTCVVQTGPPPARPDRLTVSTFGLNIREVSAGRFRQFFLAGMPNAAQVVRYRGGEWRPHIYMPYVEPLRRPDAGVTALSYGRYAWPAFAENDATPIVRLNQTVAQAFCVWDGGRLPTVAEMLYLLHCWPNGGREVTASLYPLGHTPPRCDDGNWGGGDGTAKSPCPLRLRTITWPGRFRPYGPFDDLIGNVEEWRADRCNPLGHSATDPLCLSASEETAPGETERSWFFYGGGSIDTERFEPTDPGTVALTAVEMPRRHADWEPTSTANPVNEAILGIRCAYDVP